MAATAGVLTETLYDARGRAISLRGPGRSGGEGTVYEIQGQPLSLAKLYHPQRITEELRAKIETMAASPPTDVSWDAQRHRSIAWVQEPLYADPQRRRFAGFTMPRIDTRRFRESHLYFDPQDRVRLFGGAFTWRHLLGAATNVASAVAAIHAQGHRVGDLRETNVLVDPSALIALIDCDSFEIHDTAGGRVFPCRVGTSDFLPRELQGADFRKDHDRTHADSFALGVLIFKLLMQGAHPYQARGPRVADLPSIEAKIARGLFAFERRRGVEPPPFAPPYEIVPPALRKLFRRCFVDGHRRPRARPAPHEWFAALKQEGKRLSMCGANPSHWFGKHLRACPWCAMTPDPFPAAGSVGRQTAVVTTASARAPRVRWQPPAAQTAPVAAPARQRRWPRVRLTKRRALAGLGAVALLSALLSPLGHASAQPQRTPLPWRASVSGPCPFDPADGPAPGGCRARWSLGPATWVEQRSRRLFVLQGSSERLEMAFTVRFAGAPGCTLPWMPSLEMNERAAPLCFGECDSRIELRDRRGRAHPLVGAGGVGAREGPLRCGTSYRGTWVFDTGGAGGPLRLHAPAFGEVRIVTA